MDRSSRRRRSTAATSTGLPTRSSRRPGGTDNASWARWRRHCPTIMSPPKVRWFWARLIELCFQTAGLWEISVHYRMGLPQHIDRVCLYRAPELADGPLYAVVTAGAAD